MKRNHSNVMCRYCPDYEVLVRERAANQHQASTVRKRTLGYENHTFPNTLKGLFLQMRATTLPRRHDDMEKW